MTENFAGPEVPGPAFSLEFLPMRVDQFDFDLPNECIALRPAKPRDSAKMLVVKGAQLEDASVNHLANFLKPGDALVFNDTKVIPAQLEGKRLRRLKGEVLEARASITLHMRLDDNRWLGFAKGTKKLKRGDRLLFTTGANRLEGTITAKGEGGEVEIAFDRSGDDLDEALVGVGHIPLPPYIAAQRPEDEKDRADYQTIYAEHDGAVAAPTAGLHFTDTLMDRLRKAGISSHFVTLHVGAGTFLPVKADDTDDHKMHFERGVVDDATARALNDVRRNGGRIVSVGTTSLRLLESAACDDGKIKPWSGATDIFITPGYRFKAVDVLMTNFHLPRSTLFMLVSAFAGVDTMREAYHHAIDSQYRFYSYGDSSLLFPEKP